MKKILSYSVVLGSIVIVLLIIVAIVWVSVCVVLSLPLKYEGAEKFFKANDENMIIICDYFSSSEFSVIYISPSTESGIMYADGQDAVIKNMHVIHAIENLKEQDCEIIKKNGNTISFQIWSDLDSGRGVVFSTDRSKPTLQFLTKLEELCEDNWYYYEEDFNEWR